jgi:uncharacterized RDD family membrane protein YckC
MTKIGELIREGRKRHEALGRLVKQPKQLLWMISAAVWVRSFFKNSGQMSVPLIGLAMLTVFLFYYAVPLSATRLFVRRVLALFIDVVAIYLVIVPLMLWYRTEIQQPEDVLQLSAGRVLTVALWSAVMYFVVCDWRYGSTIGKRLVALRVTDLEGGRLTFCRSFIRSLLSLPIPILVGVLLGFKISAVQSLSRLLVGQGVKQLFVSFIPMSILFLGGNQSVIDLLTRTMIRAEREPARIYTEISSKTWSLLCISTVAWAALNVSLLYFGGMKNSLDNPTEGLPSWGQLYWIEPAENLPPIDAPSTLWLVLPIGSTTPTYAIRNIDIVEKVSITPMKFRIDDTHFTKYLDIQPYLKATSEVRTVRITLARDRPSLIKVLVLENYRALISQNVPTTQRPFIRDLQLMTENDYGLFVWGEEEDFLLCGLINNNNQPITFYSPLLPFGSVYLHWSLDHLGALLAGMGIPIGSMAY